MAVQPIRTQESRSKYDTSHYNNMFFMTSSSSRTISLISLAIDRKTDPCLLCFMSACTHRVVHVGFTRCMHGNHTLIRLFETTLH